MHDVLELAASQLMDAGESETKKTCFGVASVCGESIQATDRGGQVLRPRTSSRSKLMEGEGVEGLGRAGEYDYGDFRLMYVWIDNQRKQSR